MGGALGVSAAAHARARRERAPALADAFAFAPTRQFGGDAVDAQLIAGAVLFGVGWGFLGVCPGPAFVGLALPLVARDAAGAARSGSRSLSSPYRRHAVADLVKREGMARPGLAQVNTPSSPSRPAPTVVRRRWGRDSLAPDAPPLFIVATHHAAGRRVASRCISHYQP